MQLIDKHHDISGLAQLVHQLTQAFFEFAAVFGSGNNSRQFDRNKPLITQNLGYFTFDDPLSQAFGDSSFTDPRFSNQAGIVFRPPA